MTGTVAPGYWFNNNSMTCMVATQWRMTYGIGAGNSSTLGHGTGGNVQFHLVRWRIQESLRWGRMNPIGGGCGMGPYGTMMQHHSVFSPYAQSAAAAAAASTSTHSSSYTQTHQTLLWPQEEIIKKMAVLGLSSSTGCLCRGAVQLFACHEVGCGRMVRHMCIDR